MKPKIAKTAGTAGVLLAVVALMVAIFPASSAADVTFGSQVMATDPDFLPTLTADLEIALCHADLGTTGTLTDDTMYFKWVVGGASIVNYDLRITPFGSRPAGSLVLDGDNVEKGAPLECQTDPDFQYADVNGDTRYNEGDCLFVSSHANTVDDISLPTAGTPDDYTVRLTPCGGKLAGTIVQSGDSDWNSFNGANAVVGNMDEDPVGFFDKDASGSITPGDKIWATRITLLAPPLAPLYSIELTNEGGQTFGNQVKLGSNDFVPTLRDEGAPGLNLCRIDFGTSGVMTDDGYYVDWDADNQIETNDLRLIAYGGKPAGSFVADADEAEHRQASDCDTAPIFAYGDVNSDGRYDAGDVVYVASGASGTDAVEAPAEVAGVDTYTIRLTGGGNQPAGSLVLNNHQDFLSYNSDADNVALANAEFTSFDRDLTASVTGVDSVWVYTHRTAALAVDGSTVPQYSIRLAGASGAFGSQVTLGDSDIVAQLTDGGAAAICRIDFGEAGTFTDDTFYLDFDGTSPISTNSVRLTAKGTKMPGSLVTDQDTTETVAAAAEGCDTSPDFEYADVNGNVRYDAGDLLYVCAGSANEDLLAPDAGDTPDTWCIRLMAAGGQVAGSLVLSSHSDFTTWNTRALDIAGGGEEEFGYFDADLSGSFTAGDTVWVDASDGAATGDLVDLYATRIAGPGATARGGGTTTSPGQTTTTSPGQTTTTSPGQTTTTSPGQTTTTSPGATASPTKTTKTPGLEVLAIIGGIGAAAAVVNYRRK